MKDLEDLSSIKVLVDDFYAEVKKDGLLGPVFSNVLHDNWEPHLKQMYDFWNGVLFGVQGFKGNPFARHAPLPINPKHFGRWLELFTQTVDWHFAGEIAEDAKKRAWLMCALFKHRMNAAKDIARIVY